MATQPYSLDNLHQRPLSPIKKSHFASPPSPPPHSTTRPLSPFQAARLTAARPPRASSRNNNAAYYNVIVGSESVEDQQLKSDHRIVETLQQIDRPLQRQQPFHQTTTTASSITSNNARSPSLGRRNGGVRMDRGHASSSSSSNSVKSPPIINTVTTNIAIDEISAQPSSFVVPAGYARKNSTAAPAAEFLANRSPSRGRRGGGGGGGVGGGGGNYDDSIPTEAFPNRSPSRGRRGGAGGIAMDRGPSGHQNNTTSITGGGDLLPVIRPPRSLSRGPRSSRSRERQVVLEFSADMMFKEPVVVGVVGDDTSSF
ncbi:hypothetical protein HK100_008417 [Physocladia obscura]|uniref:Uncharacterized protein n=1 Tax=Physocladia obscura TaxID=109957 RepID=A0AAD5XBJ1_9FUNG|nr:hypothetical protein HK100_008417 [Physocladia obscura]